MQSQQMQKEEVEKYFWKILTSVSEGGLMQKIKSLQ